MPTFDYLDAQGRVYVQAIAESRLDALSSRWARDRRFHDVAEAGAGAGAAPASNVEDLVEAAEARLAEAFERLGLTDREVAQAMRGRDLSWERTRLSDVPPGQGAGNLQGDPAAGRRIPGSRRLTEPTSPGELARRSRDTAPAVSESDRSSGSADIVQLVERTNRAIARIVDR